MTITRTDRGRGHSYLIDGVKTRGVTTIIGDGYPKPALVAWAAGVVAEFVAEGLDPVPHGFVDASRMLADLRVIAARRERPLPDKFSRIKIADALKGLPYVERDLAANRGTEVHRLAERLAAGEPDVPIPEPLTGHVDAYLRFRDDWHPTDELVEVVVGNRTHGYCGTCDLWATVPDLADGRCLIDLKTNRTGPFGEVALQLAAYRYAETYLDHDGDERPVPPFDGGAYVLWLRADGYDLKPVQAGPDEFRQFLYVAQTATFANERSRDVIGASLTRNGTT